MKKILVVCLLLWSTNSFAQIKFDTNFESGSLGSATLIDSAYIFAGDTNNETLHLTYNIESKFDPRNPIDTTLPPSARWFYFRIVGAQNKRVSFNFRHTDPLCAVYSYDNKNFLRFSEYNAGQNASELFKKDTVYIAYFVPYTNEYLNSRIAKWRQHSDVEVEQLGLSLHERPMFLLTITDKNFDNANKKKVWVHARTHTSETPSSWLLDGLVDALLYSPEGASCRKNIVFYIVPFSNPDGVAEGLSRSNALGVNQEINWDKPDTATVIEVKNLKHKMSELMATSHFDIALNLHSQVDTSATYWVHNAKSTSKKFLQKQLLLSYLNMFANNYLTAKELSYSKVASRYVEGWFWDNFGEKTLALTLETPYSYYGNLTRGWVTTENLRDFGSKTLSAIAMYLQIPFSQRIIIDNNEAKHSKKWAVEKSSDYVYLGNDFVCAKKAKAKITYRYKKLAPGKYLIYRWAVGENVERPSLSSNKWVYEKEIFVQKPMNLKYKIVADKEGETCDAIMLVRTSEN